MCRKKTHQYFFSGFWAHDAAKVSEIGSTDFSYMEEGVNTEGSKSLQEQTFGHFPPDHRSHLGQQLK